VAAVGRLIWREEKGRGSSDLHYYGMLPVLTVTVCAPPSMGMWRKRRRMRRAVRALHQVGVRQVIWPENCPWSLQEAGFAGIEVETLYQAQADQ